MNLKIKNEKKCILMEMAKRLIIENGYKNTSVMDITKNLNIAKGSFYSYFNTKDELMEKILDEIIENTVPYQLDLLNSKKAFSNVLKEILEKSYSLSDETLKENMLKISLLGNLEALDSRLRRKLIELDKLNDKFWYDLLTKYKLLENNENTRRSLSLIIKSLINSSIKNSIYFSGDEKIFNDLNFIKNKIDSEKIKKEIELIHRIILNILKGEEEHEKENVINFTAS